jgi:hypothetical protein
MATQSRFLNGPMTGRDVIVQVVRNQIHVVFDRLSWWS